MVKEPILPTYLGLGNLIEKGHDYKTIMSMTGHSDIKSLMKYVSVDDGRIEVGRNLYSNSEDRESDV